MDSAVESQLQVDVISTSKATTMEANIKVKNSHEYPIHVMDIEVLYEEAGREKGERKAITTKIQHSCIINPRSSKLVRVPLNLRYTTPYMLKANLNIKDRVHGVYQVSTERVKQLFARDPAAKKQPPSSTRLQGQIESVHLKTFHPREVMVTFELQVKNSNFLPLKFLYADFTVHSGDLVIFKKKLVQNTAIPKKSSKVLKLTLGIPLETIRNSFPQGLPSSIIPVDIDIMFWFKETFYGMYKIDARRSGALVVPEEPEINVQKVVFTHEDKHPVAHMELLISNKNSFDLRLKNLEYQAFSKETGSSLLRAKFKNDDDTVIIPSQGNITVPAVARPSSHEFGSVLWQLCKPESYYNVKTVLEASSDQYGKFVFQS